MWSSLQTGTLGSVKLIPKSTIGLLTELKLLTITIALQENYLAISIDDLHLLNNIGNDDFPSSGSVPDPCRVESDIPSLSIVVIVTVVVFIFAFTTALIAAAANADDDDKDDGKDAGAHDTADDNESFGVAAFIRVLWWDGSYLLLNIS